MRRSISARDQRAASANPGSAQSTVGGLGGGRGLPSVNIFSMSVLRFAWLGAMQRRSSEHLEIPRRVNREMLGAMRSPSFGLRSSHGFIALALTSFFLKSVWLKYVALAVSVVYLGFMKSYLISIVNVFATMRVPGFRFRIDGRSCILMLGSRNIVMTVALLRSVLNKSA